MRDQLKQNVNAYFLARAKQEIQEIVEREWTAAKSKSRTRKGLARYRGEGIQKRDRIEPQLPAAEGAATRVIGPTKPNLLLQPAPKSLVDRSSDLGVEWNATDLPKDEEVTDLKLVRPEVDPAGSNGSGTGKKNKKTQESVNSVTKKRSKAEVVSTVPTKKQPAAPAPDSADEELDMTGWSGDYDLSK